jgi:TATA-box binding protein (TBP) (component of TFIID and TFIIIB)
MDPPTLTTMVVLYTVNVRLNTNLLLESLPLTDSIIKIEKQGVPARGSSKRDLIKRRAKKAPSKRTTGFGHNSITLVSLDDGDGTLKSKEITVKIFQNGVFHITGVLDERYDRSVMKRLRHHIMTTCPQSVGVPDDVAPTNAWTQEVRRVVLMNYKTRLTATTSLSRETLYSTLRQSGVRTEYEPAVYPAVKIYFPDAKWIAKVFRTGNIILTGMTTHEECARLLAALHPLIDSVHTQNNGRASAPRT